MAGDRRIEVFAGALYPINPRRTEVLGRPAYPSIKDAPTPPDVAILALPGSAIVQAVGEAADADVGCRRRRRGPGRSPVHRSVVRACLTRPATASRSASSRLRGNAVVEADYNRMAPHDVTCHTGLMYIEHPVMDSDASFEALRSAT